MSFSEQLRAEGLLAVHRWKFLLVGAANEDMAKELAERIRNEAPSGSRVSVEGTWAAAYAERHQTRSRCWVGWAAERGRRISAGRSRK